MPNDNIKDIIKHYETHYSIKFIKENLACSTTFLIRGGTRMKYIAVWVKPKGNKNTGFVHISPSQCWFKAVLLNLTMNMLVKTCTFPSTFKEPKFVRYIRKTIQWRKTIIDHLVSYGVPGMSKIAEGILVEQIKKPIFKISCHHICEVSENCIVTVVRVFCSGSLICVRLR